MTNPDGDYVSSDIGPFAMIPLWIVQELATHSNGTAALTVFATLHAWTNRERTCYPAIDTIAEFAGVTAPTVKRALRTLESVGALRISRQPNDTGKAQSKTSLYQLLYVRNDLPSISSRGVNDDTPGGVNDRTPGGVNDDTPNHIHLIHIHENQMDSIVHITQEAEIVDESEIMFDRFWQAYPRSEGKKAARRRWDRMTGHEREAALAAIAVHVDYWRETSTERQFIPHASTWLNGRRWEDEFEGDYSPSVPLAQQISKYARIRRQGDTDEQRRGFDSPRALSRVNDGME
jgi:hypothetical protein